MGIIIVGEKETKRWGGGGTRQLDKGKEEGGGFNLKRKDERRENIDNIGCLSVIKKLEFNMGYNDLN